LMDWDGLTYALASHKVKYLMDNCEAYRGLEDFGKLLDSLGSGEAPHYRARAKSIAAGIERMLWNPANLVWPVLSCHPGRKLYVQYIQA
jgi:hypothetical protein